MGLFEAVLIGKSTIFGFVLFGGPILYICRNQINENLDEYEEEQREIEEDWKEIEEGAKKAEEILNDYSFKFFLPCDTSATGWILDYEIPDYGHYPTKWYIATNAHVANKFRFEKNDYEQKLPISEEDTKKLRTQSKIDLFPNFDLNSKETCDFGSKYGYFDFNLAKSESGERLRNNYGGIKDNKMEEPKLFYAPIDFLSKDDNKGIKEDNYKDFAVIEVEFKTQKYAKEATNNFYEKYGDGPTQKTPLNVFKDPLDEEEPSLDYYSLGYQKKANHPFEYTFSYDKEEGLTSQLAVDSSSDGKGRVSATEFDKKNPEIRTRWADKQLNSAGHFYLLDNFAMGGGASGGLVIDKYGNVLGLRSIGVYGRDQTLVVPLRSEEIDDGIIKTPKYDLILGGGPKQLSSYKEQVEKEIFSKRKKNTWLSQRGKWKEEWEKRTTKIT